MVRAVRASFKALVKKRQLINHILLIYQQHRPIL
jgi:hypothetical protein